MSDRTCRIRARIILIVALFWVENVGWWYFPHLHFGMNRTCECRYKPQPRAPARFPHRIAAVSRWSLLWSWRFGTLWPPGLCATLSPNPGGVGSSPVQHRLCCNQPRWQLVPPGLSPAGGNVAQPIALLRAMLGLAWNQFQDWWAVTGTSLVTISLLPSQSQLGAAEDLAQCLVLAIDYLSLVMKSVCFIPSRE